MRGYQASIFQPGYVRARCGEANIGRHREFADRQRPAVHQRCQDVGPRRIANQSCNDCDVRTMFHSVMTNEVLWEFQVVEVDQFKTARQEANMTGSTNYAATLEHALRHALSHLDGASQRPIGATVGLDELRTRLGRPLAAQGLDPTQVIDDLVKDVEGGIIGSTAGRFFGWVIGGTLPAALAADWLTSTWDQNAAIHACGPAEAVIEEVTGVWLKDLFGLPQGASFAFVTGTQAAHVTCLASARHRLLKNVGWDVEEQGLAGAPAIRILTSSERHGSITRAGECRVGSFSSLS